MELGHLHRNNAWVLQIKLLLIQLVINYFNQFINEFVFIIYIAPGPGNYRNPSDFGHYDHLNLFRTQENFRTTANNNFNRTKTSQNINFWS